MIKNVVFKGGGVLGIAYAGALNILENKGILKTLERTAGTSAGAIVACLVALKYTAAEITDIVNSTDFKAFEDDKKEFRVLTKYGLYAGDEFLKWMREKLTRKGLSVNATFADLASMRFLDLNVFATDLNTKSLKRFCVADTPNVCVAEAVRASISIPMFFNAYQFENNIPDDHIYVDGGILYNFPITCFDTSGPNPETLGLFLTDLDNKIVNNGLDFNHIGKYIKALSETILNSQNVDLVNDAADKTRTIFINSHGVSAIDFGIDSHAKNMLYESGRLCVLKFFI